MSNSVDEKVVSLKFDNSDFEQKAEKSISSIEKLNKSIDFSNHQKGGKGLEALSQTIKSSDLSGMEKSVSTISERFTNLGIMGVTALQNITNKAVDAGTKLVKSLTIDPIKSGLDEYELKMGSMRTILASTRNEFNSEAEAVKKINEHLNELNKYSDETIYSFSDMTNNIGKFTNAGVKLDVAVQAIKGISNEAAISGANANEASRAMYNFSQALSAGYVKLIDWKSIENANMATKEFKEQLIETAVATGNLTKKGDVYLTSKGKEITATKNFNDSLQDQWMTTEVLTTTLNNYATDVTRMSKSEREAYEEKLKSIGYTDQQIKKIEETGTKAYEAAAEVTTWSKLVDTLQEAVQSGWAQTFEILFGNIKEATKLWTGISTTVSRFIDITSSARNVMLQEWKDAGGRTAILNGIANVLKYIGTLLKPIGKAFREVFPPASGKALAEASKRFEALTKTLKPSTATLNNIRDAFVGLFSVIRLVKDTVFGLVKAIIPAGASAGSLLKTFFALAGSVGRVVSSIVVLIEKTGILKWILSGIHGIAQFVANSLSNIADVIESILTPMAEKMSTSGKGNPFSNLADSLSKLGSSSSNLEKATKPVKKLKDSLTDLSDSKTFVKIENGFSEAFGSIQAGGWSTVLFQILKVIALATVVKKTATAFGKHSLVEIISKPFKATTGVVEQITGTFKSIGASFSELSGILKAVRKNLQMQTFKTLAASILMLSASVYLLSRISISDMKKALVAVTYISGLLVAVAKIASSDKISSRSLAAVAVSFVAIGTSLNLVAIAAKVFASMSVSDLAKTGVAITAFVLGLSKMTTAVKGSIKGALSFALIAGSLGVGLSLLVPAILILSKMKVSGLVKAGASLVAFIVLITRAASLAGKDKISVVQFIGIAAAISVLTPAIVALANLPFTGALKAATGIALIIAAIGLSSRTLGKDKIAIVSFIAIAAAINILAPAMVALSEIPFAKAMQAAGMLGATLAILTTAIEKVNGGGAKGAIGNSITFIAIAVAVRTLAGSLIALSEIPFAGLTKAIASLVACLGALSIAGKIASKTKKNVLLIAILMTMLSLSFRTLSGIDFASSSSALLAMSTVLVAVSAAAALLSAIPFASAIAAIGKFAIFLVGITAIITALGAIASKFDGFVGYLKKGAKIGTYIGEFIGGFVGGIVGGLISGVSSGLVILGRNLSAFMESLKPFLDGVKSVSPETATYVKNLAKAILYITAADLLNTLNSTPLNILSGGGMVSFAKDLGKLIDALKPIGEKANDVPNIESINKISKTIAALAKATTEIPSVGGVRGLIMGVKDLGEFGKQLGTFVDTLSSMQENDFKMGKTDLHSISNIAHAVKTLGEAANEMPETTVSLKGIVFGMKDIGKFAEQLASFAPKFSEFMSTINSDESNISAGGLDKVIHMGRAVAALAKAANEIPQELDSDSLMAKIDGVKDLPKFADGITAIGSKVPALIEASAGMDKGATTRIIRMANVIKAMATAANEIHEISGGGKRTIGADFDKQMDELGQFTDGLSGYAESFKGFAETAKGIGAKQLEAATSVSKSIKTMSEAAVAVSGIKGKADGIKEKLDSLASGLESYANKVNGLDVGNLSANTEALKDSIKATTKALSGGKKSAKSSASSAISSYVKGLKSGANAKSASDAAASVRKAALDALNKTSGFTKAGNAAVSKYVAAVGKAKGAKGAGKDLAGKAKDAAKEVNFNSAGVSAAEGFAAGLRDSGAVGEVASAGTALGNAAYDAAKKAIKSHSPSKKFMELGRYSDEGMAIGLNKYSDLVYKAGKKVGIAGLEGTRNSISDLDLMLTDPHITPVLDLSNVQKGADQINSMLGDSANIDANLMNASVYRQNGGKMDEIVDRLGKVLSDNVSSDSSPKEMYSIGDVTVDVSKLEDVTTLNQFVDILKMAKSIA